MAAKKEVPSLRDQILRRMKHRRDNHLKRIQIRCAGKSWFEGYWRGCGMKPGEEYWFWNGTKAYKDIVYYKDGNPCVQNSPSSYHNYPPSPCARREYSVYKSVYKELGSRYTKPTNKYKYKLLFYRAMWIKKKREFDARKQQEEINV